MMAFDPPPSPPAPPGLEPTTVEAIRTALTRSITTGNHSDNLGTLLCTAAAEARSKGIVAERLLIILKDIWFSLPDVMNTRSPDHESALLQEAVSRCIQEYYAL